ncbi:tryptophan halogenase family protein [Catenovulum adriaticum]|uniref:Tryptophan 7-halogenase n=1 Tax=Catenovulum adriaticum TaxID=2984846 RepID=A0ABY7ATC3_9ALTE|nr:tryptophan halogenase family protein [Catenovulum sp. TS8]WAJ72366.1 tryptophan 7-halogenase [Catenovulum sp. TS8]
MQSTDSLSIEEYVIVGGGTAGWITAAILAHSLKHFKNVKIKLVESPDIPTIGVGEATIPSIIDMLTYLKIPLVEFINKTDASFKLAIRFDDWLQQGHSYWHPFGKIGNAIDNLPFYQHWLKHAKHQGQYQFSDFSPSVALAEHGKFYAPRPGEKTNLSASSYALHFNAGKVAEYLKTYSLELGVEHIKANVTHTELTTSGAIKQLKLDTQPVLAADFFFDCSGQKALLIDKSLRVGYQDWQSFLPVNRALAVQTKPSNNIAPYTIAKADKAGWQWQIPLQSRTGNGYVYCDDFIDQAAATTQLLNRVGEENCITEPRLIRFKTGKRNKMWHKNCVAIGLSGGFLEPLESTSIYLIMRAALNFVQALPDKNLHQPSIDEYNRLMDNEYLNIRDFIVLHYCTSKRTDSEFWQMWQHLPIPASLSQKLDLFTSQGRLMDNPKDLFASDSWYAVLAGMQVTPNSLDPLIERSNFSLIEKAMHDSYTALQNNARQQRDHKQYLNNLIK